MSFFKLQRAGTLGFGLLSLCLVLLLGCGTSNDGHAVTAGGIPLLARETSVRFEFLPPTEGAPRPNLLANIQALQVVFRLTLVNPGNTTTPFTTLTRVVPVTATGAASVVFTGIPARTVIGEIRIDGGTKGGQTVYHGAKDLVEGVDNVVMVTPAGTKDATDVVVQVIRNLLSSPEQMAAITSGLVSQITGLLPADLTPSSIYDQVTLSALQKIQPEPVVLASPLLGSSFWNGQDVTLTLAIPDSPDPVTGVVFDWAGTSNVAQFTVPPFTFTATNLQGQQTLTARITYQSGTVKTVSRTLTGKSLVTNVSAELIDGTVITLTPDGTTPDSTSIPFKLATFTVALAEEIDAKPSSFNFKVTTPTSVVRLTMESSKVRVSHSRKTLTVAVVNGLNPDTQYRVDLESGELRMSGQALAKFSSPFFTIKTVLAPAGASKAFVGTKSYLTWSPFANATGYCIYQSSTPGVTKSSGQRIFGPAALAYTNLDVTSFLQSGVTSYFVVTAVTASGESAESAEVSFAP